MSNRIVNVDCARTLLRSMVQHRIVFLGLLAVMLLLSAGCATSDSSATEEKTKKQRQITSKRWYEDGLPIVKGAEFETQVLNSKGIVVLEFFTPRCGACRQIAPIYKVMADEYADQVAFLKIDAKKDLKISKKFDVIYSPTFIVFVDGKEVARHEGHRFEVPIREALNEVID